MTPSTRRLPRGDRTVAPWLSGVLVGLLALVLAGIVLNEVNGHHREDVEATVRDQASVVKTQLELAIRERTVLADALAAFVRTDPDFSETAFRRFSRQLLALQPDVRAVQLAPGAVIQYVEPLEGNEAAVGLDLLAYGLQRDVVRRTIESDRFVVGGPVPLVQGGSGMIARLAITIDHDADPATDERFWGLAQIVIDTEAVLGATDLAALDEGMAIGIRGVDSLGADGDVFYGSPSAITDPVLIDVLLPGGSWQLSAAPESGWPTWAPAATPIALGGVLLAVLVGVLTWSTARRPAELRRRVAEATDELRAGQERIAAVMNTARDAILAVDRELRVLDANPAAEELHALDHDTLRARRLDELLTAVPDGGGRLTTLARRAEGEDVTAEVTLDWGSDGQIGTVVIRDVTAQEEAKRELERYTRQLERLNDELTRVDALKRDFIGMASHEVRTPITAIRGFSMTLATRWTELSEPDRRRCFEVIHRQTERLWRLVDDLLVASNIESRNLPNDTMPSNIATLVSRAIDEAGIPRSQTVVSCPSDLEVEVPRDNLQRIVGSFLHNARKYGEPPVEVTVRPSSFGTLLVRVDDHGDGVSEAFVPHLFDPFTQASTGETRTAAGAGLGLAVARGLAEAAGGRVWYERNAQGGASFSVEIPTSSRSDAPHEAAAV